MFKFSKTFSILCISAIVLHAQETDVMLESMLLETVKNNPAILSKQNSANSAKHLQESSKWQYFPTPIASYSRQSGGVNSYTLGLQQPLFAGGKIDAQYAKSKLQVSINQMSADELKQSIAIQVVDAYNSLLSSHGKILIYQDEIERLQKQKEMIYRRIEQGISSQSDSLLVESRMAQTKADLSVTEVTQEKALAQLSQFMARKIILENMRDSLPEKSCSINIASLYQDSELIEKAIKNSPSIHRIDYQIKALEEDVKIKESAFYPNIAAKFEKTYSNQYGSTVNNSTATIAIDVNPGAGLSSFSNFQSAKVDVIGAKYDKQAYLLEYTQILQSEISDYELTYKRYDNYVLAAEGAEKTLHSYERLFVAGKKSWLEVLNSEKEWTNTLLSLNDAQAYLFVTPTKLKIYANEMDWQRKIQ